MRSESGKVIIWDFDGVIGDTYAMNWGLVQILHPDVPERVYRIDHHLGNVFEHPAVPFTRKTTDEYFALYNQTLAVKHLALSAPVVRRLSKSYGQHIVTSNCEHAIRRVLMEDGLGAAFDLILGRAAHTSKVTKFKTVLEKTGTPIASHLFVTDTLGDVYEAQKIGLPTIAVTYGYHPRETLEVAGVPLAESWEELELYITNL